MILRERILRLGSNGAEMTTYEVQGLWPEHSVQTVSSVLCAMVRAGQMTKREGPAPEYEGKPGQKRLCNFYRVVQAP